MNNFIRNSLVASILFAIGTTAQAVSPISANTDAIINLPLANTWKLFTTVDGLTDAGYQQASINLALGDHIHAESKTATSVEVIDGNLTSFDPEHMLSWRWTNNSCWSVLYFNAMGNDMTQIRWVDFCADKVPTDLSTQSKLHRDLFDKLIRRYAPECHVCKEEREAAGK